MQTKGIFLVLTVNLLLIVIVKSIEPVCFNCHCSLYSLDSSIKCKEAIKNKSSYFTLWTKNVSVVVGSDVVLAVEIKSYSEEYCWCTDAKLEWNEVLQHSSGRLLTVQILNATKTEAGHYWTVLYLNERFYFSNPTFLNVTGPDEIIPLPPLEVDPKIGALVVGVLFVVIMFLGIAIHCSKLRRKSMREKQLKALLNRDTVSESGIPLTWELQHPGNIIEESDPEQQQFGPQPRPASDLDEEGSLPSKEGSPASESLSSVESKEGEEGAVEGEENVEEEDVDEARSPQFIQVKAVQPVPHEVTPANKVTSSNPPSPYNNRNIAFVPIKDDRFSTERSWYRSLNTEIVSESLLSNKDWEAKKEEKRRRKSLAAQAESFLAQGILRCGDIGSGVMGSNTQMTQERVDRINKAYNVMNRDFKYGRSLPTPQPAGARPTVMTIFPAAAVMNRSYVRAGATIHTSNPNKHRHVKSLFNDPEQSNMTRNRSVQFSDTNITKRFNSADDLPSPRLVISTSATLPRKSNLKSNKSHHPTTVIEVDGSAKSKDGYENHIHINGSAPVPRSSSDSSSSKEEKKKRKKKIDLPRRQSMSVPELGLTPASPVQELTTATRFTVKRVSSSDLEIDGDQTTVSDPLGMPCWDFSMASVSSEDCGQDNNYKGTQRKMQHLTVPGPYFVNNQNLDGYWTS